MTIVELMTAAKTHLDRCLIALYHACHEENKPALYTREIVERLKRSRISKASKINVSDVMSRAGALVDGELEGPKGRRWALTGTGRVHVEGLLRSQFGDIQFSPRGDGKGTRIVADVRLLFVGVSPIDAVRLRLDREHREIQNRIRASEYRDSFSLLSGWATRPDDLFQLLHEHTPHIVHFSGHGSPLSELAFEETDGSSKPVTGEALAAFFSAMKDDVRLVVLNSCHSADAASLVANVIDCSVGMNDEIDDEAAIVFSATFYRSIGFGKSIGRAFREARAALAMEGKYGVDIPTMFHHASADPEEVVLAHELPG